MPPVPEESELLLREPQQIRVRTVRAQPGNRACDDKAASLMCVVADNRQLEQPRLIVLDPTTAGKRDYYVIGRSAECSVQVPHHCDLVSREHLKIELKGKRWFIMDMSSKGTACRSHNAEEAKKLLRLQPKQPFLVKDGMQFFLGSFKDGGAVVKIKFS